MINVSRSLLRITLLISVKQVCFHTVSVEAGPFLKESSQQLGCTLPRTWMSILNGPSPRLQKWQYTWVC